MLITKELREEMAVDIRRCDEHAKIQGSEALFSELRAKYSFIDADFAKNLSSNGKVTLVGEEPDYRKELGSFASKLRMWLIIHPSQDLEVERATERPKVFIVHGHDKVAIIETARTLEKLGFEAVILHEQASAGKTIIEKIESYTDVSFAVVLYTPCDIGCAKDTDKNKMRNRARQNVIFEHGYLIGKLGRKNVCALIKGDIETPGDISGVVYIGMDDNGNWRVELARAFLKSQK